MGWFDRENDVDQLFKEGLNVKYPYNPNLWTRVAFILDTNYSKFLLFNGLLSNIGLLIVLFPLLFFTSNNPIVEHANSTFELQSNNMLQSILQRSSLAQHPRSDIEEINHLNITNGNVGTTHPIEKYNPGRDEFDASPQENSIGNQKDLSNLEENEYFATAAEYTSIDLLKRELIYAEFNYADLKAPITTDLSPREWQNRTKKQNFDIALIAENSIQLSRSINFDAPPSEAQNGIIKAVGKSSFGLELIKNYKALRIGIGLRISEFTENVNYSTKSTESNSQIFYDTTYTVVNDSYDENGKPVILIRQNINARLEENTSTLIEQERVRNTYKRLQLPITVGLEKRLGKITTAVRSGVIVNYALTQNGTYFSQKVKQYKQLQENASQINPIFIGHLSTAEIGYLLNNSMAIGASYSYEADLGSFRTDNTSRFQSQNFGIWLRWKLDSQK